MITGTGEPVPNLIELKDWLCKSLNIFQATLSLLLEPAEDIPSLPTELEEDVPHLGIPHLGPLLVVPGLSLFRLFVLALVLVVPVGQELRILQPTVS